MSRVAKQPISIPANVELAVDGQVLNIKGPKGKEQFNMHPAVEIAREGAVVSFVGRAGFANSWALAGTTRALISNVVRGVTTGFERKLDLVGVGYKAQAQGKVLNLTLGFSHPVVFPVPEGVTIDTPTQTEIIIKGADKQLVGQTAAKIRAYRPPEPYKGKGVKYSDEVIVRKEAKKK